MSRDDIYVSSPFAPKDNIALHADGGGSPAHVLARITRNTRIATSAPLHGDTFEWAEESLDIMLDEAGARALFNWLGVWLVTRDQA
jgi:hypothetical protein